MQGLVTIGTAAGAAELEVAAALCDGSPGAQRFAVDAAGEAAPLIEARLAGSRLDPEELVEGARRAGEDAKLLVVATSGGLMAPITERFLNRDLARELALPVVLAAPAAPGLTAGALLALDSARGNGLAGGAVLVARWPHPPRPGPPEGRGPLRPKGGGSGRGGPAPGPPGGWAAPPR